MAELSSLAESSLKQYVFYHNLKFESENRKWKQILFLKLKVDR